MKNLKLKINPLVALRVVQLLALLLILVLVVAMPFAKSYFVIIKYSITIIFTMIISFFLNHV